MVGLEWSCNDSSERSSRISCLSCKPRFKGSGGSDSCGWEDGIWEQERKKMMVALLGSHHYTVSHCSLYFPCKTKPVKIWVTAESLLCGHWCEDREAGWGLSHLSVQTHLRMFPLSFPLHDLHPQSWVCFSEIQGFIFTLPFTDEVRSPQRLKILIQCEVIWWIYALQNCLHSDDMCKVRHISLSK